MLRNIWTVFALSCALMDSCPPDVKNAMIKVDDHHSIRALSEGVEIHNLVSSLGKGLLPLVE